MYIHLHFFTIYCSIVTTGSFSHNNYQMKPQDILSRTYVCQTMCVFRHPKILLPIMIRKTIVCYKNLQGK